MRQRCGYYSRDFYPRSPCGERRPGAADRRRPTGFLSTLSLRRATVQHFGYVGLFVISIHALLAESDRRLRLAHHRAGYFYPRSPCGERRGSWRTDRGNSQISIHALLAESDAAEIGGHPHERNFYPRSPCGERPQWFGRSFLNIEFLSTLSLRRATHNPGECHPGFGISIHALLAESDAGRHGNNHRQSDFYPRSPCGERHSYFCASYPAKKISIHALLAESDAAANQYTDTQLTFLSTLSLRRATKAGQCGQVGVIEISIHALLAESDRLAVGAQQGFFVISIHALLAESDGRVYVSRPPGTAISIHALLAESDWTLDDNSEYFYIFLSTLSLRRATPSGRKTTQPTRHFYPRSPCGERLRPVLAHGPVVVISIHALLAESDLSRRSIATHNTDFYPRSPCGERPAGFRVGG